MNTRIMLTKTDYKSCLSFVLKLRYLWGGRIGDFRSSGVRRDIGKYIHDHISGKLAEIAFIKFCEREFCVQVKPDFERYESSADFSKGDVIEVYEDGVWREPNIIIDVKDTKPSSRWELIPANLSSTHATDYFAFVCVHLPLDHLIQYFKEDLDFENEDELLAAIPDFITIQSEIVGLLSLDDLKRRSHYFRQGDKIPEVDIFSPRVRDPPRGLNINEINDGSINIEIGSLGILEFELDGRIRTYSGLVERTRRRTKVRIHEMYIRCLGNVVLKNSLLGEYHLQRGLYKVVVNELSALRENNFGIPIRVLSSGQDEWIELLSKI